MPDLEFRIVGVEPASHGLTPLLHFRMEITKGKTETPIRAIILRAQVQIQSPQRSYSPEEKDRLVEVFGGAEQWSSSLRNKLWTHTQTMVGSFDERIECVLPVQCTYDMNILSTKYFAALEGGNIPLLFLFNGSIFYSSPEDERLQVEQISWEKECAYMMPVRVWKEAMNYHFPGSAWLMVREELFNRLWMYRRREGCSTWDQTVERLLDTRVEKESQPLVDSIKE